MAFNDWFVWNQSGTGVTGSARMMSAMESITSGSFPNSGSFCRAWGDTQSYYTFDGQFLNNITGKGLLTISSSYNSSALYGIPPSKAISLRAYFRVAQVGSIIGLGAKIRNNVGASDMRSVGVGYRVYLYGNGSTTDQRASLAAGWNNSSYQVLSSMPNLYAFPDPDGVGNITQRLWHHLRLDVIPVTASFLINNTPQTAVVYDIVNIYTGSLGNPATETWSLVSSKKIDYTSSEFTPWSATDAYGIIIDVSDPSGGSARSDACIENFEIYTSSI